jgi:hypothetical protein
MKILKLFSVLVVMTGAAGILSSQQTIDNSLAKSVIPWRVDTKFSGTCKFGEMMTRSDLTVGESVYTCGPTNNWVQSGGGGNGTGGVYCNATGAATNTLVCNGSPVPTSYVAGMNVSLKVDGSNTGAATLSISGLGTKNILTAGVVLPPGALVVGTGTGNTYSLSYDGTQFNIVSVGATGATGTAGTTGPNGAAGSLGNAVIYTASRTMDSGTTDNFYSPTFNGTSLTYTMLATPANANYWTIPCNASTTSTLTVNAVANAASIYGQGSPTNITIVAAATAGIATCVRLSSNPAGTQWVVAQVGSPGVAGPTGPAGSVTVISQGTSALGTSSIASAACATVVTTVATGVLTTDPIQWTPNGSIKAITGYVPATTGGLTIAAYPTANAVNFDVCNWSAGSIIPGALTLNWRVAR